MSLYSSCKNAFFNGERNYKAKNYVNAKYWYKQSIEHSKYRNESFYKLFLIEIRQGRFDNARELLFKYSYLDYPILNKCYAILENVENNFNKSIEHYKIYERYATNKIEAKLGIANNLYQMGEYDCAFKSLEKFDDLNISILMLNKAIMFYYKNNYYEALKCMNQIDTSKLGTYDFKTYKDLNTLIKFYLGKLKKEDISSSNYFYSRLFDQDNSLLLKHISEHINEKEEYSNGIFIKDININELFDVARKRIEFLNGTHYSVTDVYKFSLDKNVGYKSGDLTKDICVLTYLGTKDIVTIYPIINSEEYDKEGMLESRELKAKRLK